MKIQIMIMKCPLTGTCSIAMYINFISFKFLRSSSTEYSFPLVFGVFLYLIGLWQIDEIIKLEELRKENRLWTPGRLSNPFQVFPSAPTDDDDDPGQWLLSRFHHHIVIVWQRLFRVLNRLPPMRKTILGKRFTETLMLYLPRISWNGVCTICTSAWLASGEATCYLQSRLEFSVVRSLCQQVFSSNWAEVASRHLSRLLPQKFSHVCIRYVWLWYISFHLTCTCF